MGFLQSSPLNPSTRARAARVYDSTPVVLARHCLGWCVTTGGFARLLFAHNALTVWACVLGAVLLLAGTVTGAAAFLRPLSDARRSRLTFVLSGWASMFLVAAAYCARAGAGW